MYNVLNISVSRLVDRVMEQKVNFNYFFYLNKINFVVYIYIYIFVLSMGELNI